VGQSQSRFTSGGIEVGGGEDKFAWLRTWILSRQSDGRKSSVLDVGCRDCVLRTVLGEAVEYQGADLFQNSAGSVNHLLDLERPLPFADRSFDIVTAMDVVEHVENFDGAVRELCRISRVAAIVMIPNLAHIQTRVRFLRTGRISGKYDMKYPASRDRHRWFTVQPQADEYFRAAAADCDCDLETVWFLDGKKRLLLGRVLRALGFSPAIWVWASIYVLRPKAKSVGTTEIDPKHL
jgi:SAM-dependent methyltransferase